MIDVTRVGEPSEEDAITLLYVRPDGEELTELDRRVGLVAERYARWVVLRVVTPEELPSGEEGAHLAPIVEYGSPALLLLRRGEVVAEAIGALLPARELDDAVWRALARTASPPQ